MRQQQHLSWETVIGLLVMAGFLAACLSGCSPNVRDELLLLLPAGVALFLIVRWARVRRRRTDKPDTGLLVAILLLPQLCSCGPGPQRVHDDVLAMNAMVRQAEESQKALC